jgi:uncharacterized protein YndB with AHSA1/START domain
MSTDYSTTITIEATADEVFDHFTDPELLTSWMGDFARLDPTPGGEFTVDINGVPVRGAYLHIERPNRLVISWGHAGSDQLPPGTSAVEITFTEQPGPRTLVELVHRNLPEAQLDGHAVGWGHFLPRLSTTASGHDPGPDPWASNPP